MYKRDIDFIKGELFNILFFADNKKSFKRNLSQLQFIWIYSGLKNYELIKFSYKCSYSMSAAISIITVLTFSNSFIFIKSMKFDNVYCSLIVILSRAGKNNATSLFINKCSESSRKKLFGSSVNSKHLS